MVEAATAGIDAFALNIAAGSNITDAQLPNAFDAAASAGFKLFFSFDYAGNGAWDKADVVALLNKYAHHSAYFQHSDSTPLVSTFEGPDNAADWVDIKGSVGCFLIPDWSSLGAKPAVALEVSRHPVGQANIPALTQSRMVWQTVCSTGLPGPGEASPWTRTPMLPTSSTSMASLT